MDKKQQVLDLINSTDGKIFSISFYKKNGELRKMAGRIRVRKDVTGTGMSWNPVERGYKPVYDMNKGWRMVNLQSVTHFKCGDKEVLFDA